MTNRMMLVIASSVWLGACGTAPHETKAAGPQSAPVAVQTVTAAAAEWPAVYEATGTVRARTTAVVSARMMGYVREVKAQTGDHVKAGQVLAILDARELDASLHRATAGREEVHQAMGEADAGVAAATAGLDLAQATFRRMQDLYSKKSISTQEFDEAQAHLKAAEAQHEMALARRKQLDSRLKQAEQEVNASEVTKGFSEIAAPFAGVVTAKSIEPGNLATPGAPLFTIEREGAFRLEAAVEESRLGSLHVGEAVGVHIEGLDKQIEARVSEIVPAVDAASRSGTVKIDLPAMAALRSGMFGRALFTLEKRKSIGVPSAAVERNGQLESVYVAEDGVARTRLVTLGQTWDAQVEVLSGLSEGEKVIYPAPAGLTEGARVEVR